MDTTAFGMRRTSSHTRNLRRDRPIPEIGRNSLYPRYQPPDARRRRYARDLMHDRAA
jgi:hypothetical protein